MERGPRGHQDGDGTISGFQKVPVPPGFPHLEESDGSYRTENWVVPKDSKTGRELDRLIHRRQKGAARDLRVFLRASDILFYGSQRGAEELAEGIEQELEAAYLKGREEAFAELRALIGAR